MTRFWTLFLLLALLSGCVFGKPDAVDTARKQTTNTARQLNDHFILLRRAIKDIAKKVEWSYAHAKSSAEKVDKSKYEFGPDGVFYKSATDGRSAMWISGFSKITDEVKESAYFTESLDPEFESVCQRFPEIVQVYFNSSHSLNRIYPPFNVLDTYTPGLDITAFNFYYLADEKNNPTREAVWVREPYIDPAGRGLMVSAIAPAYLNDKLVGVAGLDITIKTLLERYLGNNPNLVIVDSEGVVIAAQEEMFTLFALPPIKYHRYLSTIKSDTFRPGDYSLLRSRSESVREMATTMLKNKNTILAFNTGAKEYTVVAAPIDDLGWTLLHVLE